MKHTSARVQFQHMVDLDFFQPSSSLAPSRLNIVAKKDTGDWRPCGDYHRLNVITVSERYPIPNIQEFSSSLRGCKTDLCRAYHKIPLSSKTAIKTS